MVRRLAVLATCNLNQWALDFDGNLERVRRSIEQARAAGATTTSRASRAPSAAEACGGSERYVHFDPVTRALVERAEAMRVSWYATDGSFREVRTGRGRDELARESDNVFTAPARAGDVRVWIVLRDERGGVTWRALGVRVEG